MKERERMTEGAAANEGSDDLLEERLRRLYTVVYPPTFPPVGPSAELRQRVTEITARPTGRPVRRSLPAWAAGWRQALPSGWGLAAGAVAAAGLLVALGLLTRGHYRRAGGASAPPLLAKSRLLRNVPGPRPAVLTPQRERGP